MVILLNNFLIVLGLTFVFTAPEQSKCHDGVDNWVRQLNTKDPFPPIVDVPPRVAKANAELRAQGLVVLPCLIDYIKTKPAPRRLTDALEMFNALSKTVFVQIATEQKYEELDFNHAIFVNIDDAFMISNKKYMGRLVEVDGEDGYLRPINLDEILKCIEYYWASSSNYKDLLNRRDERERHGQLPLKTEMRYLAYNREVAGLILLEQRFGIYNIPRYLHDISDGENGIIAWQLLRIIWDGPRPDLTFSPKKYITEGKLVAAMYPTKDSRLTMFHEWWTAHSDEYKTSVPVLYADIEATLASSEATSAK